MEQHTFFDEKQVDLVTDRQTAGNELMDSDAMERGKMPRDEKASTGPGAAMRPSLQTAPEEAAAASFWPSAHCRRHVTRWSAVSLAVYVCIVLCCLQLPPLPTAFSRRFHEKLSLELELSPQLFDLTTTTCKRTAFCQHLVLECAPQASVRGTSEDGGDVHRADCSDMRCCLALPSLAADVQSVYLENLHRQPDSYGIEYYCKKVESGQMSVSEIRHRMASSPEGRLRKEIILKSTIHTDYYLVKVVGH